METSWQSDVNAPIVDSRDAIKDLDAKLEKLKSGIDILMVAIKERNDRQQYLSPVPASSFRSNVGPTLPSLILGPSSLPGPSTPYQQSIPLPPSTGGDHGVADLTQSPNNQQTPYSGTWQPSLAAPEEKSARLPADLPRFRGSSATSIQDPEDFLESYQDVMVANSYPRSRWATAMVPRLELEDRSWLKGVLKDLDPSNWEEVKDQFLAHIPMCLLLSPTLLSLAVPTIIYPPRQ